MTTRSPTPFDSRLRWLTQIWIFKEFWYHIVRMEIVIYRRQRVDYREQSDTTCLVPKFACCVAGPSEFFIQRFSIERSRTASPVAVLQRAIFYHDVDEIFWPQPIRLLKLGHVTGRRCMSPTWVGRVSDLGKNGFHKKCKNLDNIAVYLTAHLELKWKNKQKK